MKFLLLNIILLALFTGCAHHRDVRPNENGIHIVSIATESKDQGFSEAKSQAEHFCKQSNKIMYVVSENHKYVGSMDEDTYKKTKTGSKIAEGVGAAGMIFGGKKESDAGAIVGAGGFIADGVAGKGYKYTMSFKCK